MRFSSIPALSFVACLSACASAPAYIRVGAEPVSVVDLREAKRTIQVLNAAPAGAESLGPVNTIRCHRRIGDVPPTEQMARDDLLIAALSKGATGLTGVRVTERPAAEFNCWKIFEGSGEALKLPLPPPK